MTMTARAPCGFFSMEAPLEGLADLRRFGRPECTRVAACAHAKIKGSQHTLRFHTPRLCLAVIQYKPTFSLGVLCWLPLILACAQAATLVHSGRPNLLSATSGATPCLSTIFRV